MQVPPPAADGEPAAVPEAPVAPARQRWRTRALVVPYLVPVLVPVLVVAVVVVLAVRERAALAAGVASLAGAHGGWLAAAAVCTVLLVVSGTVSQTGATHLRTPFWRLFAVQVAGTFANQVLPGGSGGMAVNVRFLRRRGLSRESALAAQALNTSAGAVTHALLFVAAIALAPVVTSTASGALLPDVDTVVTGSQLLLGAAVVGALVLGCSALWRRFGTRVRARLAAPWAEVKVAAGVLRDPRRGLRLWLGALSGPLLHVAVLWSVLHALAEPLPLPTVAVVYLGASALSSVVPSPGGFGALDVTLLGALVTAGLSPTVATATVVAYRLVTVWLPLLPGACVLAVLVRQRIV